MATNDVHYVNPDDARLQDILLAIQTQTLLSDPSRMRMTDNSYYLRTPQEMSKLFAEVPEALSNTLLIAERCNVDLGFKGYHLPEFPVPEGYTAETYLRYLCQEGAKKRYGERAGHQEVQERLDYELGVVHKMGFEAYFLIVSDLCRYAREKGIWYNARGSAAGSIIAYVLQITLVDPLAARSALRTLPKPRPHLDARHRPGFPGRSAQHRCWSTALINTAATRLPRSSHLARWEPKRRCETWAE